jgi:hypothetical protein
VETTRPTGVMDRWLAYGSHKEPQYVVASSGSAASSTASGASASPVLARSVAGRHWSLRFLYARTLPLADRRLG